MTRRLSSPILSIMESEVEGGVQAAREGELESSAVVAGDRELTGAESQPEETGAVSEPSEIASAGGGVETDASAECVNADSAGAASNDMELEVSGADDLSDGELQRMLAALLFASPEPLGLARLSSLTDGAQPARLRQVLAKLEEALGAAELPLRLVELAGGYQLLTTEDQAETVGQLSRVRKAERLSPAALETLSVVAYRQPVSKAEVEAIRGVQAGPLLRALVDRGLIRVTGRAPVPGNPLQYGTTRQFLEQFGLSRLKDLPRDGELAQG
ncbi:MAG: SMC-Scp complex subunit ScpB [Planctomycetota bacterium]|nr:SMC-Scp complex subunit ScpB [Planctomycetota bacterium]